MDVAGRMGRLRQRLDGAGCDALLVTNLVNIRYLTGFTGSNGYLLVAPTNALFATDGRYRDQSAEQLGAAGVEADIAVVLQPAELGDVLGRAAARLGRLGLEAGSVTWAQQRRWASAWFTGTELVPTEDLIENLRRVKDAGEVARMAEAARIADEALEVVKGMLVEGASEREVALSLDVEMRRRGASGPSFETIVASGPNGAKPHARPSHRTIGPGDLVVIDFGAVVDGYCSDTTRTFSIGEPSETARRMVEVVAESQRAGVAAVAAGVSGKAVDEACRSVIAGAGWGESFLHGTGHGVGLEIHEAPRVSSASTDTLATGHVVTVEPGVYLPEHGGVRIEDTVVVEEGGCRPLTNAPKDLVLA